MAVALLVAAGRGERLGHGRPKALIEIAGRRMVDWSAAALQSVTGVTQVVVALPPGELDEAPAGTVAVAGGVVRSESVCAALGASDGSDPVIVHDAARPLCPPAVFAEGLAELARSGADAVVAAAPVTDTLKLAGPDRRVRRTIDRGGLWAIQTPQVFRRGALDGALRSASAEDLERATDDAWLIERRGGEVRLMAVAEPNFKITTAMDLRLAELLLSERTR